MQKGIGPVLTPWLTSWNLLRAWPSMPTYTARKDKRQTRTIGINVLGEDFTPLPSTKNGRHWLTVCSPALESRESPSHHESQFPTAALTFEFFFGLRLGCCASAVRAFHRANLSHGISSEYSWFCPASYRFPPLRAIPSAMLSNSFRSPSSIRAGAFVSF